MANSTMTTVQDQVNDQERAMMVAQFLTTFQSCYGGTSRSPITVEKIERALRYRRRRHCHYERSNEVRALRRDGRLTAAQLRRCDEAVQQSRARLDATPPADQQLCDLLRRFEVWSSKALAQQVLVHCPPPAAQGGGGSSSTGAASEHICGSPLLNLPGLEYFSKIFPPLPAAAAATGRPAARASPTDKTTTTAEPSADHAPRPRFRCPTCTAGDGGRRAESDKEPHVPCYLPLTPNAWTWREFARITHMVSCLPGPKARLEALTSPLTAASPTVLSIQQQQKSSSNHPKAKKGSSSSTGHHHQHHHDSKLLSESSKLTQADLVALWVRAQRHSGAWMHLLQLFHVREVPEEEEEEEGEDEEPRFRIQGRGVGGKVLVPRQSQEDDQEDTSPAGDGEGASSSSLCRPRRYVAHYVGNHKWTRDAVEKSSPKLDDLVAWAVTNQLLCTDPHIRAQLAKENPEDEDLDTPASTASRDTLGDNEDACSSKRRKRPRSPVQDRESSSPKHQRAEDDKEMLQFACETYVLRWFARRNRSVVSILFSSKPLRSKLPFYNESTGTLVTEKVMESIKRIMTDRYNSTERTLARMDRRIFLRVFQTDDGISLFRIGMIRLLKALEETVKGKENIDVPAAIRDFEHLHDSFLKDKDAVAAAKDLLDQSDNLESPLELLHAAPVPWVDKCEKCEKNVDEHDFFVCAYCDAAIHTRCDKRCTEISLSKVISSFRPLEQLCAFRIPQECNETPDFRRGKNSIKSLAWSEHELSIDRLTNQNGKVGDLGLEIRHTEDCKRVFLQFLSGSTNACMSEVLEGSFPLAVDFKGAIIVSATRDSLSTSVKQSDIITQVRVDDTSSSDGTSSWQDFATLSPDERVELMRNKGNRKLMIRVQRPNINLVSRSSRWLRILRRANTHLTSAFQDTEIRKLWCCSNCQKRAVSVETSAHPGHDAACCRAVIRRLSMESFSLPYHDESPVETPSDDGLDHSQFVSLRRLDDMLQFIESGKSSQADQFSPSNPFILPPWVSRDRVASPERLEWAPPALDTKPLELLCKGMLLLVARRYTKYEENRTLLICHFARLFSAWCLGNDGVRVGPVSSALFAREPWTVSSCAVCRVRPVHPLTSEARVCDQITCMRTIARSFTLCDDCAKYDELEASPTADEKTSEYISIPSSSTDIRLRTYDRCAALVGAPLLVLPGDALLQELSRSLNQSIEHFDRVMIFLVASYLPSQCTVSRKDVTVRRIDTSDEGVFHILPVLSHHQLQFILDKCKMRRSPVTDIEKNGSWTKLDVLELEGVIEMTEVDLQAKLKETFRIQRAIDRAVGSYASCADAASLENLRNARENLVGVETTSFVLPCDGLPATQSGADSSFSLTFGIETEQIGFHDWCDSDELRPETIGDSSSASAGITGTDSAASFWVQNVVSNYALVIENLHRDEAPFLRDMVDSFVPCSNDVAVGSIEGNLLEDEVDTDVESETIEEIFQRKRKRSRFQFDPMAPLFAQVLLKPFSHLDLEILYTDLLVQSIEDTQAMTDELRELVLTAPKKLGSQYISRTFLLDREHRNTGLSCASNAGIKPYNGIGWGFEIVRWAGEQLLRVGRVHPVSPASYAGLQMHDVIATIDGAAVQTIKESIALACVVLKIDLSAAIRFGGISPLEGTVAFVRSLPRPTKRSVVLVCYRDGVSEDFELNESNEDKRHGECVSEEAPTPNAIDLTNGENEQAVEDQLRARVYANGVRDHVSSGIFVGPEHLYKEGLQGTVMTCVESAVLRESILQGSPLLGRRLLSPRYNPQLVERLEYVTRKHRQAPLIPRIDNELWKFILRADYNRSTMETGPIVAEENGFSYRCATDVLPLDRLLEDYFDRHRFTTNLQSSSVAAGTGSRQGVNLLSNKPLSQNYAQTLQSNANSRKVYQDGTVGLKSATMPAHDDDCEQVTREFPGFEANERSNGLERIRGGGTELAASPESLAHLPKTSWRGTFVSAVCDIAHNGKAFGEGYLIGKVDDVSSASEEAATVSVFFASTHGMLPGILSKTMPAADLYLIQEGSEDFRFVEQWQRENGTQAERPAVCVHGELHASDPSGRGLNLSDGETISIKEAGAHFVKRLCTRGRSAVPLGHLPDGRSIYWYQSDPLALYIQVGRSSQISNTEMHWRAQTTFCQTQESEKKFYCAWGCSNPRGKQNRISGQRTKVIPFSSESDLLSHVSQSHGYVTQGACNCFGVGNSVSRIGHGEMILALASDLSFSICQRFPSFAKCCTRDSPELQNESHSPTESSSARVMLKSSEVLDLTRKGRGAPRSFVSQPTALSGTKSALLHLLRLWSRIARLFDVEKDGKFRFKVADCLYSPFGEETMTDLGEGGKSLIAKGCYSETWTSDSLGLEGLHCSLCYAEGDAASQSSTDRTDASRLLGCALYSECFYKPSSGIRSPHLQLVTEGPIGYVKAALVQVALAIPQTLKRSSISQKADPDQTRACVWEEDNFLVWRTQVERTRHLRTLSLAFVVLLRSIDKNILPRWFSAAKEGWTSTVTISRLTSVSALVLHLYVFDLAVCEYSLSASVEPGRQPAAQHIPRKLQRMTIVERMKTVISWAQEIGQERFTGEHENYCLECSDGGSLLCCEYCSHVGHQHCYPELVGIDEDFDWVCPSCTTDIAEYMD